MLRRTGVQNPILHLANQTGKQTDAIQHAKLNGLHDRVSEILTNIVLLRFRRLCLLTVLNMKKAFTILLGIFNQKS